MKSKQFKLVLGLILSSLLTVGSSDLAQAYWAWGPTWDTPSASRYLYVWSNSFTSAQQSAINSANLSYDSSKTNAFDPSDPGSSTLNISGTTFTANATAYENSKFRISRQTAPWGFSSSYPALTCFAVCFSSTVGTDKSTIYLNDYQWNFGTTFTGSIVGSTVDLQTVVLHELGHSHGLGHPSEIHSPMSMAEFAAVMHVAYTVKRSLTADDIKGLQANY
ncbi:MAG: hypothetical protein RIS31_811 [Actinomycetota bacterium]